MSRIPPANSALTAPGSAMNGSKSIGRPKPIPSIITSATG